MKIALCFSGQPRFVNECSPLIRNNDIQDYNEEVFAHVWFDDDLQNKPYKHGHNSQWHNQRIEGTAIDDFVKTYNPIDMVVEPSKFFVDPDLDADFELSEAKYWPGGIEGQPEFQKRQINNSLSYFYSLCEANRLRKLYEYEFKVKYDYVIRCRTDSQIHQAVRYEQYDPLAIHFTGMQAPPPFLNDWFNFGGSESMEAFMGVFPLLRNLMMHSKEKWEGTWCIELLHVELLERMGITSERHPFYVTLPRF